MRGTARRALAGLLLAVSVGRAPRAGSAEAAPAARRIDYRDDRLTVQVAQTPLEVVITEIAAVAGAELRGQVREPREVTIDFEDVPVADGLRRLLRDQNFTLTYGQGNRLTRIGLKGGPQAPGAATRIVAVTPTTLPTASAAELLQMFERTVSVPPGRLADAIGGNSSTYTQLAQIATSTDDAGLRAEAVRVGMMALEGDAELKGAVVGQLQGLSDTALADVVRNATGDRGRDVMLQVMAHARSPEIRNKATVLMRQFRRTATPVQ